MARQFIEGGAGQLHLRYAGARDAPPLLLLHDAPGSSEQAEVTIRELAKRFFVIAPDLPGTGESDPWKTPPTLATLSDAAVEVLDRLEVAEAFTYGIGFGSSVALQLARSAPDRVSAVALQGVLLPDVHDRAALHAHYAPPIAIEPDGSHWYRTWLMLRDMQVYWPWYDRRQVSLRRTVADFEARTLHRWTMDVMRARASYEHPIRAALAEDAAPLLQALAMPVALVRDVATPLSVFDDRARALRPDAFAVEAGDNMAAALATFFGAAKTAAPPVD
jgi:pimeloyl-ACP methyl ester carboxylesterase